MNIKQIIKTYYLPHDKKEWANRIIEWFMIALLLTVMFLVTQSWREGFTSGYNYCIQNFTSSLINGI